MMFPNMCIRDRGAHALHVREQAARVALSRTLSVGRVGKGLRSIRSMIRSYISIANGGAGCDQLDVAISAMIRTVMNPYRFVSGRLNTYELGG